ncbi:22445_t:CDS:1, partial [Gigaspora rosea]
TANGALNETNRYLFVVLHLHQSNTEYSIRLIKAINTVTSSVWCSNIQ